MFYITATLIIDDQELAKSQVMMSTLENHPFHSTLDCEEAKLHCE